MRFLDGFDIQKKTDGQRSARLLMVKKITMGEADFLVSEEVRQAGRILNSLL